MMAARGLAPLGPRDLATAIYQLTHDADAKVAEAASQTAGRLPENILGAALADALDARVIDYFAARVTDRASLCEKILLNAHTHDETFVALASKLPERELELLATNQQRLLRHPPIIEALYFNPAARASTVDRVLELAVRNGIEVKGIPQFKELAALIMGGAPAAIDDISTESPEPGSADQQAMDDLFASMLSQDVDEGSIGTLEYENQADQPEEVNNIAQLSIARKIRLALLGKQGHRAVLVRDANRLVAMAAIKSPKITEHEVALYAGNRSISEDVIRYIADRREWHKNYAVKVALVGNPKCPLAHAMRLLTHLRPNDLRLIARSKNVPSALAQAAKRLARG